jgi:peptidoglycan/xylan/chitin deacetylase (PgdA/CDA1 family)
VPPAGSRKSLRRRLLVPCLLATLVMVAVSGCHSVGSPAAGPSPSAPAKPRTPKPTATHPVDPLAAAIASLPKFPPAPAPSAVKVPGGGSAPIFYRMPVKAPVAFLTMDDGLDRIPANIDLMKAAHIPFTMFLIGPVGAAHPDYFKQLVTAGGVVEDHTVTHTSLRGKSYAFQKNEICGARSRLAKAFGRAPTLFRPPFGNYDATTLKVVHDCGLKAAFYWSETVRNGKVFYQTSVHKIRAGDIILMHFRPTFAKDVVAALKAIHQAGLTPALLEDYISPPVARLP